MFNSMGATNAWQPIQSRSEMADVITASPCRGCDHEFADKNKCKLSPDCILNIPTIQAPKHKKTKKVWTNTCTFPGCKERCPKIYCHRHDSVVRRRIKLKPGRPIEYYHMPVQKGGRGQLTLDEMWDKLQMEKAV